MIFDHEFLIKILEYDPLTGLLKWRIRSDATGQWNGRYAGKYALTTNHSQGYKVGSICDKKVYAHRIAWAIYYGSWPDGEIDHINGIRNDNRIENLRDSKHFQNQCNRGAQSNNSSGLKGAHYVKRKGKWSANICTDGKRKFLGLFSTPEEAHECYSIAANKLHKQYARIK